MKQLVVLVMLVFGLPTLGQAQPQSLTIRVDGVDRRALVFPPANANRNKTPLVFVFHGAGDTAANFSQVGFQTEWGEAAVVYMEGLGRIAGQGGAFQTTDPSASNRDLRFFDAALAEMRSRFPIDAARIYATGFSNGAKFVYLLWATRASIFAGFAPVAGMLTARASLDQPKPVLHVGGRQDHQNEFELQLASVEMARRVNGVAGPGVSCGDNCLLYMGGRQPVMTILHPGGHVYPAGATARIVAFFKGVAATPSK